MAFPVRGQFQPRYIQPAELAVFGLPTVAEQPNILSLVDSASTYIDEYCGRTDGTGQGSLAYTTYAERLLLQARNRNVLRLSFKPLAAVSADVVNTLQASANAPITDDSQPLLQVNTTYTGVQANSVIMTTGSTLSPIIGASGRYGYARRGEFAIYPDLNYGMNLLQVAAFFGGPPGFTPIDPSGIDCDLVSGTGEIWVPAGLYLSQYTEIVVVYNSGFDPRSVPRAIKQACAGLIRNLLARAGGVSGVKAIMSGKVNAQFTDDLVDTYIERMLMAYKTVLAY